MVMERVPTEIKRVILTFLPNPQDLTRSARVCREWKTLAMEEELWKMMFSRHFDSSMINQIQSPSTWYSRFQDRWDLLSNRLFVYPNSGPSPLTSKPTNISRDEFLREHNCTTVEPKFRIVGSRAVGTDCAGIRRRRWCGMLCSHLSGHLQCLFRRVLSNVRCPLAN